MDPTLSPFNFEPTGLTPEQLAAMVPQMGVPANIPTPTAPQPHPLEGSIPRMLAGAGGQPNVGLFPWDPLPMGEGSAAPPAPAGATPAPVGGGVPEAIASQLARWGVSPTQVLPGLPQGGPPQPSVGSLLAPSGVGGEVARNAAATMLPPNAQPASGMAPPSATAAKNPFQGLTMPTAPAAQKVSTPAAPKPTGTIKGGELLALLQTLGAGPTGLPLPSLASAIGR